MYATLLLPIFKCFYWSPARRQWPTATKKTQENFKKGSAMFSHLGYTRASGTSLGFEILGVEFSHIPNIFFYTVT